MFKSRVFRSVLIVLFVLAVNQSGTTSADESDLTDLPITGRSFLDFVNLSPSSELSTGVHQNGDIFGLQVTEPVGASPETNLFASSFSIDGRGRLDGDPSVIPVEGDVDFFAIGQYLHQQNSADPNSPFITSAVRADFGVGILSVDSTVSFNLVQSGQFLNSSFTETDNYFLLDAFDGSGAFNFRTWRALKGGGQLNWEEINTPTTGVNLMQFYGSYRPYLKGIPGTDTALRTSAVQHTTANDKFTGTLIDVAGGSAEAFPIQLVPHAQPHDPPKEVCLTPVSSTVRGVQAFTSVGGVFESFLINTDTFEIHRNQIGFMPANPPGFVNGIGCGPGLFGAQQRSVFAWGNQIGMIDATENPGPLRLWELDAATQGAISMLTDHFRKQEQAEKVKQSVNFFMSLGGGSSANGAQNGTRLAETAPGTYLVTLDPREAQSLPQLVLPATDVVLSNHGSEEALVDFRVISQTGDFLETQEVQLQPFGSQRISLAGSSTTLTPSWGWIASFHNGISATATYTFDVGGGPIPNVGVSASTLSKRWGLTGVVNPTINTGLAVSNPTNDGIQCTLNLFPSDGTLQGTADFEVAARGQISQFLTQFNFDTGKLSALDGSFTVECSDESSVLAITQEAATGFLVSIPGTPLE